MRHHSDQYASTSLHLQLNLGVELPIDLLVNRYPTAAAEDSRTAYMRLVLWAAAAKGVANFYGLDPSDDEFRREQTLLRSRSQQLLGAGAWHDFCQLLHLPRP